MPATHTYVVRIWWETSFGDNGVWRASVTETSSREKRFFSNPRSLAQFLGIYEGKAGDEPLPPSASSDHF